jgi:hypothetical protein
MDAATAVTATEPSKSRLFSIFFAPFRDGFVGTV